MVREGTTCLGMEYFVFEGDELWDRSDDELIALATGELASIGLVEAAQVQRGYVVRMPKAYPVYDDAYRAAVDTLRHWLGAEVPNVHPVGRNGMHKYNNQDHSMYTAMLTVENIVGGRRPRHLVGERRRGVPRGAPRGALRAGDGSRRPHRPPACRHRHGRRRAVVPTGAADDPTPRQGRLSPAEPRHLRHLGDPPRHPPGHRRRPGGGGQPAHHGLRGPRAQHAPVRHPHRPPRALPGGVAAGNRSARGRGAQGLGLAGAGARRPGAAVGGPHPPRRARARWSCSHCSRG